MALDKLTRHPRRWLNSQTRHQGYPIHFRRHDVRVTDANVLSAKYPVLLVLQQDLLKVQDSGLPEADYNDSLAPLDHALVSPFSSENDGLVALVETFAGRRTYYIYVAVSFDSAAFLHGIAASFPEARLTCKRHDDPTWKLFRGYAADLGFD